MSDGAREFRKKFNLCVSLSATVYGLLTELVARFVHGQTKHGKDAAELEESIETM